MLQFPLYLGHSRCISLQDWGAAPYHQSRKSHQYTWLLPSNLPRKDQLVSRDLHAGTTQPPSAHHSLHSLSQPLKGQVCHPTPFWPQAQPGLFPHTYLPSFSF